MSALTRAERNAAIAAAASARTAATCPWAPSDGGSEAGSQPGTGRGGPSSRSTCPWNNDEAQQPKNRRSNSNSRSDRSTCPWGADAKDGDSARLADAARRRNRGSPKNNGAAGSGAPKLPTGGLLERVGFPSNEAPAPAEATQRLAPEDRPIGGWGQPAPAPSGGGAEFVPGGPDDDDDQDAAEQREIIQHCLSQGLGEEEILEMLEQWQNDKLLAKTRERMDREAAPLPKAGAQPKMQPRAQPKAFHPQQAVAQPEALGISVGGTSLAASRMAKGKKSLSFGPADEEIVDILQDYAKENLTPPDSQASTPNSVSLAAKRKKDKETSVAAVGAFDSDKSRAAYVQSRNQMDAVKNKNRNSQGIF